MSDRNVGISPVNPQASPALQSYSIEMMPLYDGRVAVGIVANLCEDDGEFATMDMGSHRVATFAEAVNVIRDTIGIA